MNRVSIDDEGDCIKLQNYPMIERVLKCSNVNECKPTQRSLRPDMDPIDSEGLELTDRTPYERSVGPLMCLANMVRLNLSDAVSYVARHMHKPNKTLWMAYKHVLRYFQRRITLGLVYKAEMKATLEAYSDAN